MICQEPNSYIHQIPIKEVKYALRGKFLPQDILKFLHQHFHKARFLLSINFCRIQKVRSIRLN